MCWEYIVILRVSGPVFWNLGAAALTYPKSTRLKKNELEATPTHNLIHCCYGAPTAKWSHLRVKWGKQNKTKLAASDEQGTPGTGVQIFILFCFGEQRSSCKQDAEITTKLYTEQWKNQEEDISPSLLPPASIFSLPLPISFPKWNTKWDWPEANWVHAANPIGWSVPRIINQANWWLFA